MSEFTVQKDGRKYTLVGPDGARIETVPPFTTKAAATAEADRLNATPRVVKSGSGWLLVADSETVGSFRSKRNAEAALAEYVADGEPVDRPERASERAMRETEGGTVTPADILVPVPPAGPVATLAEVEAMDRVSRLMLAKAEHVALVEWRESGGEGSRPSTPVLDFFADPAAVAKSRKRNGNGKPRTPRNAIDSAVEETVAKLVVAWRTEDALSWTQIAKLLNGEAVPPRAAREAIAGPTGEWTDAQVYALARRHQLAVFGPNRDQVK